VLRAAEVIATVSSIYVRADPNHPRTHAQ